MVNLPNAFANVTMCALVLEDSPVGEDNKLVFESFPEQGIEEAYAVGGYREIAADRMPQPGFVAYRGGNWSTFSLELKFRAGNTLGRNSSIENLTTSDIDEVLRLMERKVRWCQALTMPKEREARSLQDRIKSDARAAGLSESDIEATDLGQLTRNDPPFVLVQFGSFMTIRAYCTGWSTKWEHPFHPLTARPYGAVHTMTFQRLDVDYPSWDSVAGDVPLPEPPKDIRKLVTEKSLINAAVTEAQNTSRAAANAQNTSRAAANGLAISAVLFAGVEAAAVLSSRR